MKHKYAAVFGIAFGAAMALVWSVVFCNIHGASGIGVGVCFGIAFASVGCLLGRSMLFKRKEQKKSYDRENCRPVLRCSICTGEQVAGFQNIHTGRFDEVMLIRNDRDLKAFMTMYGIDKITKEY